MSLQEGSESGAGLMTPIRLPLNSKRLTVSHLRRLASEVGVPTAASADELRQMIDGKLAEDGKDTPNVQVVLPSAEPNSEFYLQDEEGTFLTVPVELETSDEVELVSGQPIDNSDLRRELHSLKVENQALQDCVASLEQRVEDEKIRFRELW